VNWSAFLLSVITLAGIYGIMCIALNLQFGYAGLINFGIVAYFAVGAYAYVILTMPAPSEFDTYRLGFELPVWIGIIGAVVASGLFALLTGWPSLRLRGDYLALTTFAFAEGLNAFLRNEGRVSNGTVGFTGVDSPVRDIAGADNYELVFAIVVVASLALAYLIAERLGRAPFGKALRALRDDELAATLAGKDVRRLRLDVFVLGAVMTGLAGVLYAWHLTLVKPDSFSSEVTFVVFIALVLGGVGSNRGALLGAFILIGFEELIRFLDLGTDLEARLSAIRVAMTGLLLIVLLRLRPRPGEGRLGEWLSRWSIGAVLARRRAATAPPITEHRT
jgi:branched-chain amino acid transport system permease protein